MSIMRTALTLALARGARRGGTAGSAGADEAGAGQRCGSRCCRVANYAPLVVARDKGFFTEENLNVSWTTVNQGAIAVEAVYGGSAEIGGSSIFEPMVARGNGLDIVFIAASARIRSNPPDNSGVVGAQRRQHPDRQGPRRQENLGRPDQQRELRPHARVAAAQRRRPELRAVPGDSVSADGRRAVPESPRRGLERRAVPDLHAAERQCAGDRLSLPGKRPAHGHHRLSGEGELDQGQPRRRPPLQARDRPRHHRPDQCQQGGARRLGRQIYRSASPRWWRR